MPKTKEEVFQAYPNIPQDHHALLGNFLFFMGRSIVRPRGSKSAGRFSGR
jgi:hypothetical protein